MSIRLEHVSYAYEDNSSKKNYALKDVNLEIKKEEFIAVIGHTGSGKSTLAQLLCRFYDHTKGKIYLFGKEIETLSPFFLREHIGFVEQKGDLIFRNIKEKHAA